MPARFGWTLFVAAAMTLPITARAAPPPGPVAVWNFGGSSDKADRIRGPAKRLPTGRKPGSISLWFVRPKGVSDKVLFVYGRMNQGQARGLWLVSENRLCFYFWGHPKDLHVDIRGGISAETWHHVAATYDGKTARLYYDGAQIGETAVAIDTGAAGTFHIGANLKADGRDFIGLIDDVAVYDRALPDDQIARQYRSRRAELAARKGADIRAFQARRKADAGKRQQVGTRELRAAGIGEIVFAVRQPGKDGHWYANFGYWSAQADRKLYGRGGRLCRLDVDTGKLTVLLDDPAGGVRDPQVHYDARKVLFSYRKGQTEHYHLYEIGIDPGAPPRLKQLTSGGYDDFEPTYLPDGGIVFCSSRCKRWVPCWSTEVAILHRCDADGRNVRPLSSNIEQENTPCVLPDGRVLYTRWEYVDRSQVDFHHLWTVNPDGTGQMIYYGNMHPGVVMIDAQPIPGTRKVVCSFSPGHGRREHAGAITVIDPRAGPDEKAFARRISSGQDFRDPCPVSEDRFLVARGASILLMAADGRTNTLYTLPPADVRAGLEVHEPRLLRRRDRERVVPPRTAPTRATGRLILADVAHGRNMAGVKPGEIKKLLVLECLPKPINFNGAYPYQMSWMEPITLGGSFALVRVLGTVPVEPDGSAHFDVPAMRSLFFVALDERDLSVKRMQSFVTVRPGETTGCVGCHEQRTRNSPVARRLQAVRRDPSTIRPEADVPDVLDFPRDIQPILDEHCIRCHKPERRDGKVDLTGGRTGVYSQSYWTLIKRRLVSDGRNQHVANRSPRTIGSSASRLMDLIEPAHHGVKLTDRQRRTVRLWIESGVPYAGTYAAYFSGMVSVKFPVKVMTRRCGSCHGVKPNRHRKQPWEGHDIRPWARLPLQFADAGPAESLCDLTHPEKSLLLMAPLSARAGGYARAAPKTNPPAKPAAMPPVFADTRDADYQAVLSAIRAAAAELGRIKRFDMPGYRPNAHYIREMQRYGILPGDLPPTGAVDPYAADRAYWRSLWHRPRRPGT